MVLHAKGGWVLACVLVIAPAAAQQVAGDPPVEWKADASGNRQAQKAAEKAAGQASPPRGADRPTGTGDAGPDAEAGPRGPGGRGGGGPPGGMGGGPDGGGMGGGRGGRGGHGPGGPGAAGAGHATPASMLRPEMEFAAPLEDTLVLYRSRESVLFGRKDTTDVVMLPLSGAAVSIAPGVEARLHDVPDGLRVEVTTSNGIRVNYRYRDEAAGVLRVDILAEGPVPRPGARFEVTRRYTR